MSVRRFSSESYSEGARPAAWQDVLREFGLRSTMVLDEQNTHASATICGSSDRVAVARLAAGPQALSSVAQPADLPLLIIPLNDSAMVKSGGAATAASPGDLLILPRTGAWQVTFKRPGVQAVALLVADEAFQARRLGPLDHGPARVERAIGLAAVLARSLEAAAEALDALSANDWTAVRQSLADMLLGLVDRAHAGNGEAGATSNQVAIMRRIRQNMERRLSDPELTPARVAQAEGISERYLQKLFEGAGDSFSHCLRERRLQRTWADLSNSAEAQRSVSDVAYRCGFSDAAHFSRAFRDRFGLSPRAFRQQQAERLAAVTPPLEQRGWPEEALKQTQARRLTPAAFAGNSLLTNKALYDGGLAGSQHHRLRVDASNVHWGYFSRSLKPVIEIASGETIEVETLSQHASDDPERMITGDPGAESVFRWTRDGKGVDRRGAGPMDASIFGRGAGEGFGVHICTGPIAVKNAQPGDVLEVRILDIAPRPSRHPQHEGRCFGSTAAAWWGYHYAELLTEPKPRETVTIFEIVMAAEEPYARALYSYLWGARSDPFGVVHKTYDYPGVPVSCADSERRHGVLEGVRIPLRPHFGLIGVAPRESDLVDSVPPSYFGGNLDNWRIGKGAAVYLPVSVPGALLSIGDPHAAQGDGEVGGTAIECSMTGAFAVFLHKKADCLGKPFADLTYPLIETPTEWVLTGFSHPNYLAEFGTKGQSEVYAKSSLDLAMKDAFRKVRRFLVNTRGLSEDEAIALMSAAVDFGVTQVVDGNWGVHATVSKRLLQ